MPWNAQVLQPDVTRPAAFHLWKESKRWGGFHRLQSGGAGGFLASKPKGPQDPTKNGAFVWFRNHCLLLHQRSRGVSCSVLQDQLEEKWLETALRLRRIPGGQIVGVGSKDKQIKSESSSNYAKIRGVLQVQGVPKPLLFSITCNTRCDCNWFQHVPLFLVHGEDFRRDWPCWTKSLLIQKFDNSGVDRLMKLKFIFGSWESIGL